MIDPVIFTIPVLNWPVRWYGVIVVTGIFIGAWIVERGLKRRGENGDLIWDALLWVLIPGLIGARVWFIVNDILGGNHSYLDNPISMLKIWEGGIHFFGGLLFGAVALLLYLRQNKLDPWVFLDSAGPGLLVGQAIGRIANFINQELYGPPTTLPWGLKIDANHRLPEFANLSLYPVETTRFHPTFAYEMLWNFFAAGLLLWLYRRFKDDIKPGALFSGWLLLAGLGRVLIEFFRPDQPKIEGLGISYSSIVSALMAVIGAVMLMVRYKAIRFQFAENWEEDYKLSTQVIKPLEEPEPVEEPQVPVVVKPVRRTSAVKAGTTTAKRAVKKKIADSATKSKSKTSPRTTRKTTTRAKKSS